MEEVVGVMPNQLHHGIKQYFNADKKSKINLRILIIIAIFSLILIFIGTIILLNSYNAYPTSLSTSNIKKYVDEKNGSIIVPDNITKPNLLTLGSKISSFDSSLRDAEQDFEQSLK